MKLFWRKKSPIPPPTFKEALKAEIMLKIADGYDEIEGSLFMRHAFHGAAKDIRKEYRPIYEAWKNSKAKPGDTALREKPLYVYEVDFQE